MALASLAGRGGEGRSRGVCVRRFGVRWWLDLSGLAPSLADVGQAWRALRRGDGALSSWSSSAALGKIREAAAKTEGDGGPGRRGRLVGVGSDGFPCGKPDPEQVELGAWRRPMRLHWLHPSRRRWCFLRLTKLSGKGLCLLQVDAAKTMVLSFDLRRLHVGWKKEVLGPLFSFCFCACVVLCILNFI